MEQKAAGGVGTSRLLTDTHSTLATPATDRGGEERRREGKRGEERRREEERGEERRTDEKQGGERGEEKNGSFPLTFRKE